MHYTVYQTVNLVNGKVYVGVHATENPDDAYLGSGFRLKQAIRKYGRSSFKKEILFVFDNPEDMAAKEAELVTRDFVDREDTYNLVPGGHQGDAWYQSRKEMIFDPVKQRERSEKGKAVQRVLRATSPDWADRQSQMLSARFQRLHEEGRLKPPTITFAGLKHSDETRRKMRDVKKGLYIGSGNPVFGTSWVCVPGEKEKRVSRSEIPSYLESGWVKGRKTGASKTTRRFAWVCKPGENPRRIRAASVVSYLETGWVVGRDLFS